MNQDGMLNQESRLIRLLSVTGWNIFTDSAAKEQTAETLLKNGVFVPICNVGDTVYHVSDQGELESFTVVKINAEKLLILSLYEGKTNRTSFQYTLLSENGHKIELDESQLCRKYCLTKFEAMKETGGKW